MKIGGGGMLLSGGLFTGGALVNHLLKKGEGGRARFFSCLDRNFVIQLLKTLALGGMILGGATMMAPSLFYLLYASRDVCTVASGAIGCFTWKTGAWRALAGMSVGSTLASLGGIGITKTLFDALWNQSRNKTTVVIHNRLQDDNDLL